MTQHINRLAGETSPYLLQHAHNPVDWYPWGDAAFARARAENKPIFLSIGYSACHWCHVMEHESFEDEETARLMNEHFVNIKVDREERPDVDHIYMGAVQMLTGRGGWPMSVFLTPEGKPFYGGTYFPPEDRHGLPSFRRVLLGISQAYRERPEDIEKSVGQIMAGFARLEGATATAERLDAAAVVEAAESLAGSYDAKYGGLGQAPKFPNEAAFELFLRVYRGTGQQRYLEMTLHTLRKMAEGGMYDQLGGGFHRYSVDERWLVPHFEKMLYDNAQLVPLYLEAFQISGDAFYARIARESLDYVLREMRDPSGGFYSTQDADSEGEEGKFFVWDLAEVTRLLGEDAAELAARYWDLTEVGNFEDHNILHVTLELEQLAKLFRKPVEEVTATIQQARARLFAAREQRIHPGRDEKILTAWNGLMISAFARAAEVLADERYRQAAGEAVAFIERELQRDDRLLSSYKDGRARFNGYLDDYAFYIAALLDVFELEQEDRYLERAVALAETTLRHFWDSEGGGFFFTSDDHEQLIVRSKPAFDGSIPSGNSVMAHNLLRLHALTDNTLFGERAEVLLTLYAAGMKQQPFGFANLLGAVDRFERTADEVVLVGNHDDPALRQMLAAVRNTYLPNRSLRVIPPGAVATLPQRLQGKGQVGGAATAYVCRRMTCSAPVRTAADLEQLLSE
ncbi:MAG TPA: thioredoxin domain-containing protein [Terriglobales bacterium]|nr:thioredoxin domain-containing protein [Terriglobales bacterium]